MSLESVPNRRILAADDEVKILEELCKVLAPENATGRELKDLQSRLFAVTDNGVCPQAGFDLHCCCQGDEAVDAVRQAVADDRPFAAAFLDVRMPPGPDGVWAAEQIRKLGYGLLRDSPCGQHEPYHPWRIERSDHFPPRSYTLRSCR